MKKSEATRLNILRKAFELVYVNGYQATSVDDIIATTQVTKGAFFYHFKNKEEMGLAMINEIMYPPMHATITARLTQPADPLEALYQMMHDLLMADPFMQVTYGCPAHNLIQEMAPINPSFQTALQKFVTDWQQAIEDCLKFGQQQGSVNPALDAQQSAIFIMATYGGIRNLGKVYDSTACYEAFLDAYKQYLQSLR